MATTLKTRRLSSALGSCFLSRIYPTTMTASLRMECNISSPFGLSVFCHLIAPSIDILQAGFSQAATGNASSESIRQPRSCSPTIVGERRPSLPPIRRMASTVRHTIPKLQKGTPIFCNFSQTDNICVQNLKESALHDQVIQPQVLMPDKRERDLWWAFLAGQPESEWNPPKQPPKSKARGMRGFDADEPPMQETWRVNDDGDIEKAVGSEPLQSTTSFGPLKPREPTIKLLLQIDSVRLHLHLPCMILVTHIQPTADRFASTYVFCALDKPALGKPVSATVQHSCAVDVHALDSSR